MLPNTKPVANSSSERSHRSQKISHPESMAWPFGEAEPIQLFVKMMNSEARQIEINADANDTIKIIHEKVLVSWQIPVTEQKLFYETKQLEHRVTLKECSIQNKACLELMVRWDDKDDPSALPQMIHQMCSNICRMCQGESDSKYEDCCSIISQALDCMTEENSEILSLYSVPATLVMLYGSPIEGNKFDGNNLIRLSMELILMTENQLSDDEIASLGLEFCNLLREVSSEDPLYNSCRTMLAEYLEDNYEIYYHCYPRTVIQILLFSVKLSQDLSNGLANLSYRREHIEPLSIQVRDLGKFLCVSHEAINVLINEDEDDEQNRMVKFIVDVIGVLFHLHLKDMEQNLTRLADMKQIFEKLDTVRPVSLLYLAILKELNRMSQLVEGAVDEFRRVLEGQKNSLHIMIEKIIRSDDYDWLLEHSAVLHSESRMHLLMMKMIPEKKLHDPVLYKPLIRWSKNLDEKLYEKFGKKDLTDSQVLQDWLCKLCQILFKPHNLLFLACPNDPTKFYPNPELKRQPLHLDSFEICGMVIALALMHEIHIGIAFHNLFLLQLAGNDISIEEIREACPSFYNKKAKDPSHGDDRIQNEFMESVSEKIHFFRQGFHRVFGKSVQQLLSHRGIELEDLNQVLKGNLNLEFNFGKKRKYEDDESDPPTSQNNESDPLMYQFLKVNRRGVSFTGWQKGMRLGKGGFGEVYEGYAPSGFFFAFKEIEIKNEGMIEEINHEIDLLCQLRHPNIVSYYGMERRESKIYIFLEIVRPGSLKEICKNFKLKDSQVFHYTKQILEGLNYLHGRSVAHRDIKCSNILVNDKGCVKIADFGLAKVPELNALMKSCCGTTPWMAPEVIKGDNKYGFEADIWSLGCTVLQMLTGKSPYSDLDCGTRTLENEIVRGKLPTLPDFLSELSRDFILKCLQDNPHDRPTAAKLLQHPFVKGSGF
ncbi:E3 ubiquitin-protein ligase UPL5 [Manihot esculenta]|uniref:Uncharacterized protein n=2 Tax=Manihot esculenta TaxID=3983 RepID=A0ACB7H183_MANES|nr:E3 ubiquitin-protein ligase UPL5 [Manihot esculenta]KAG8645961.1 hypothetical protein MANES_10G112023v8 [Manihot esculenta]